MILHYTMTFAAVRPDLWEGRPGVPAMVVASNYLNRSGVRLRRRRPPAQLRPLIADCGGFSFAVKGCDYPFSRADYIGWLSHLGCDYAATMDYPCEPTIAADDGAIRERQRRTVAHAAALMARPRRWAWMPVLQGRSVAQYCEHAADYRAAGLVRERMGVGSLCRRTDAAEVARIVAALAAALPGVRFHLFGVKLGVFAHKDWDQRAVASADTGAWNSGTARQRPYREAAYAAGMSQIQDEVWGALPRYRAKVGRALRLPVQMELWEGV